MRCSVLGTSACIALLEDRTLGVLFICIAACSEILGKDMLAKITLTDKTVHCPVGPSTTTMKCTWVSTPPVITHPPPICVIIQPAMAMSILISVVGIRVFTRPVILITVIAFPILLIYDSAEPSHTTAVDWSIEICSFDTFLDARCLEGSRTAAVTRKHRCCRPAVMVRLVPPNFLIIDVRRSSIVCALLRWAVRGCTKSKCETKVKQQFMKKHSALDVEERVVDGGLPVMKLWHK
eukprot:TRINITY_DN45107_c0_g1_i1.p2 TRINITY_DN45107_c0_g1~~TRINITY_DN45107_c0_g1_i1.p2  ORF type:complete len:236 (-),score=17.04 TRINITY_DN45107_c0_g1_i1:17-724(-)